MTATFNISLATPLDRVRQLIGDTNVAAAKDVEIQDETISYYLSAENGNELRVAWLLACDLMGKYARQVEIAVDHQTSRADQAFAQYAKLKLMLEDRMRQAQTADINTGFTGVYVGGLDDARGPYDLPAAPDLGLQ